MITGSQTSNLDKLLASFQGSETSAENEEKRDAFARLISGKFGGGNMATQSASSPAGAPMQNGVNGTNSMEQAATHQFAQTPVPLPSYAPTSRSASASSAPFAQRPSASPAPPTPFIPPGQHHSPPMQPGALNHATPPQGPRQSPQMQNGNFRIQTPQMHSQQVPTQTQGHMSPPANQQPQPVQSSNHYQDMVALIDKAPASAVRQVVRDKWEKALMGSQYHIAFLLNATMHQASPETISKAVQEFGSRLVKESKRELLSHLSGPDLDQLADMLLSRVSTQFLDKALARRLETIDARDLVNALARAERLGYDVQDIVQEHSEHVIPSLRSLPVQPTMPPENPALRVQHYQPQPVAPQQPPPATLYAVTPPVHNKAPGMPLPPGPPGIAWCRCGWPCASQAALEYHYKKNACHKVQEKDEAGKDICFCCGCRFGSGGGLLYHEKSNVCGAHTRETSEKMRALIAAYRTRKPYSSAAPTPPSRTSSTPVTQTQPPPTQSQSWTAPATSQPTNTPSRDPYAHLNPDTLKKFNAIMKDAEEKYGGLMRQAMDLSEPEKSKRLASLKNSYNTKQSTTRKKFGIRLRERRTKGEIEAEEARLMGTPDGNSTPSYGTPAPDSDSRPKKRPRMDDNQELSSLSGTNGNQESPRKRVPVSEMGGLSGSQATAELTDPTANLNPAQPRYTSQKSAFSGTQQPRTWSSSPDTPRASMGATQDDPMSIDDEDDDSDSDSDSDGDGDIPATIS
ncbi:hypothetical protein FSARC_9218 [Fusarium sarcochroum]|uniref:Uncharacterized protein n=1 Tax=Fusarium sarcochroum TaxID=1208366 RepID=A0A8H4X5G1_9HYPO|nr:hypothetical protein FSARC_9218 [Fusarium sarcochroum]